MKSLSGYIQDQINESYQSKSLSAFIKLSDDKQYEDWVYYNFRIFSKFTDTHQYSKRQISKALSLANWEDKWFLEKNDKKIFNQDELKDILNLSNIDEKTIKDADIKKSTCIFLFTKNNNGKIDNIIAGMIMDPKYGKESIQYLKKMEAEKNNRKENKSIIDELEANTQYIKISNDKVKEYSKNASKEQIDLLNEVTKNIMKNSFIGKSLKNQSIEYENSKWYNNFRSRIMALLIDGDSSAILNILSWHEKISPKIEDYVENACKKIKK